MDRLEAESSPVVAGLPPEALEIDEGTTAENETIIYPIGLKMWLSMASVILSSIFVGLDMAIVAVAIPRLIDQFRTVADIGWYSATHMLIYSSFTFLFSRLYSVFSIKTIFVASTAIFELGSLLCTVAPTSPAFILGRAIAGLGSSGLGMGGLIIVTHSLLPEKRPVWTGSVAATQFAAMVVAPLIGGALIDAFSWRACFGINLPIGVATFAFALCSYRESVESPDTQLKLWEKLKRMDPLGTCFFHPFNRLFADCISVGWIKIQLAEPDHYCSFCAICRSRLRLWLSSVPPK